MVSNHTNTEPSGNSNKKDYGPLPGKEFFESDTRKIVRRHLQDKDHVITDEEIAGIRIGMMPPVWEESADTGAQSTETQDRS